MLVRCISAIRDPIAERACDLIWTVLVASRKRCKIVSCLWSRCQRPGGVWICWRRQCFCHICCSPVWGIFIQLHLQGWCAHQLRGLSGFGPSWQAVHSCKALKTICSGLLIKAFFWLLLLCIVYVYMGCKKLTCVWCGKFCGTAQSWALHVDTCIR